jgi:uncharacterized protein (TIGR01244 family)
MFAATRVSDRISVGGQPSEADLDRLAERGFRAVINLRTDDESNLPISPEAERAFAETAGLAYRRLPIRPAGLRPHEVEAFRAIARDLPGPIFVHCAAGERASAISVLAEGVGETADATLLEAARQGIAIPEHDFGAFIRQCFGTA